MRPVRAPVIISLLSGLVLFSHTAPAEVIHLKNGRTIWSDHVHENGAHVEYDVGEDSYAIPKSAVDRIEAGGVRPQYSQASATKDISSPENTNSNAATLPRPRPTSLQPCAPTHKTRRS